MSNIEWGAKNLGGPGSAFHDMSREDLLRSLEMFAKNWLAHDGSWFLAVEERLGMEAAMELDAASWRQFARSEARRIMDVFHIPPAGGLEALEHALKLRMYSLINLQHFEWYEGRAKLRFRMDLCRVQETRRRKGLPDYPCRRVGTVEFETFARTIDPRIQTACIECPPDAGSGRYCAWEFRLA